MAFVASTGGITNLNQAAYSYGFFADTVLVLSGNNTISTWEGNDLVYTTRVSGSFLQTIYLGMGNDTVVGGSSYDEVRDGSGTDTVSLGSGTDKIFVGRGNDTYDGQGGFDFIAFYEDTLDDGSTISNAQGVTVDLARTTAQNFGVFGSDVIRSFEGVIGSRGKDVVYGTNGANNFSALDGADLLWGRGGNDTIYGGEGADTIIGGAGQDTLFGGPDVPAARDVFRFLVISDSTTSTSTCDIVQGFDRGGTATDDKIDLSAFDGNTSLSGNQVMTWRGSGTFATGATGQVRVQVVGADTIVHIDTDSDTGSEMVIKVAGVTGLTSADFIL